MADLAGYDAFVAVSHLLDRTDRDVEWQASSPAIERLRRALVDPAASASPLDLAVLLRQAMTHEHIRRGSMGSPAVLVSHPRFEGFAAWDQIGLRATPADQARLVTLLPWKPAWLTNVGDGVESFAASETTRREFNMADCEGDPLLAAIGRSSYRSRGQRAAVRAALDACRRKPGRRPSNRGG